VWEPDGWPPFLRRRPIRPDVRRPDSSPEGASRLRDSAGIQPDFAGRRVAGSWPAGCTVARRPSPGARRPAPAEGSPVTRCQLPITRCPLPATRKRVARLPSPAKCYPFPVTRCQLPGRHPHDGFRLSPLALRPSLLRRMSNCGGRIAEVEARRCQAQRASLESAAHAAAEPDPARRRRCRPRRLCPPPSPFRRDPVRRPHVEAGMKSPATSHQSPARGWNLEGDGRRATGDSS